MPEITHVAQGIGSGVPLDPEIIARSLPDAVAPKPVASSTPGSASTDAFEAEAYFAEGVYAKACASRERLIEANRAKIEEPKALARAIREVYAEHPLVKVVQEILGELGKFRNCEMGYVFRGPQLMLTAAGFRTRGKRGWEPVGDSVTVGACKYAAAACQKIRVQLASLAEDPEANVVQVRYGRRSGYYRRADDDGYDGSNSERRSDDGNKWPEPYDSQDSAW